MILGSIASAILPTTALAVELDTPLDKTFFPVCHTTDNLPHGYAMTTSYTIPDNIKSSGLSIRIDKCDLHEMSTIDQLEIEFFDKDYDVVEYKPKNAKEFAFVYNISANRIAKKSYRGKGNTVIYNDINKDIVLASKDFHPNVSYVASKNCPKNKVYVTYMNKPSSFMDAPMMIYNINGHLKYAKLEADEQLKYVTVIDLV